MGGHLTWWLSPTRANVPMNREAVSPFVTEPWISQSIASVGQAGELQPRFKRRQIRLPSLGGRTARFHCRRAMEMRDITATIFRKENLSLFTAWITQAMLGLISSFWN